MQARVLIADDEHTIRKLLKTEFEAADFQVDLAADGQEAVNLYEVRTYAAAVLDISMPGLTGLEVLDRIKLRDGGTVVIMMTAYGSIDGAVAAIKRQADDYIAKPFDPPDLIEKVQQTLRVRRRIAELGAGSPAGASTLLGKSAAMEQIRATVAKVKDALLGYDWPGNVRELENTLESAVVLSDGPRLGLGDLPKKLMARPAGLPPRRRPSRWRARS